MQVSISNLTDNLSEINKNESKSCKKQKKNLSKLQFY